MNSNQLQSKTRRSFLTAAIAAVGGVGAWRWINSQPSEDGIPWPLRRSLEANAKLTEGYFRNARLAREFPPNAGEVPKVNGVLGLDDEFTPAAWSLDVTGLAGDRRASLRLADIQTLPKVEFVTELKCVEGWSRRVRWAGARLADFARRYRPAYTGSDAYVGLETPDGEYYVGLDLPSALHPQTLLCYEMDGRPLTDEHGAPLRLVIPIKYGIKNLKRIGRISFTNTRPPDYWAERGYDYYAGF